MPRKLPNPLSPAAAVRGRVRRRTALVTVVAAATLGLAGCGDPDDDDGGGGGYVAAPLAVQGPASPGR